MFIPRWAVFPKEKEFPADIHENVDDFFEFLIEKELGFFTETLERFPDLDISYDTPEIISNCILEYGDVTQKYLAKIVSELTLLRCKFLELRFYSSIT